MRPPGLGFGAALVLLGLAAGGVSATAQEPTVQRPRFWHAAGGVLLINAVTWSYNWYVQRWHWANVGTRAWWTNFRNGFTWDDDDFMANQLAHPYHGSLYYQSARANGYNFWESAPYVLAGSLSWELLTENVRPSLNDLVNTSLGGIALGEVTYRLGAALRSSSRSDPGLGRGVASFALSPVEGAQALFNKRKDSREVRPVATAWSVGRRTAGTGITVDRTFLEVAADYGSVFDTLVARPYDAFEFRLQLSPESRGVITHVGISGLLRREDLSRSGEHHLALGLFHHYEYRDLPGFRFGGQSISGALLLQRRLGAGTQIDVGLHLEGLVLGSVSSDHGHVRRRDYDYGPGAGARLGTVLRSQGRELVRLDGRVVWLRSVYGSDADHLAGTVRAAGALPVAGSLGVGAELGVTARTSWYGTLPRVTRRVPEARAYLTWQP